MDDDSTLYCSLSVLLVIASCMLVSRCGGTSSKKEGKHARATLSTRQALGANFSNRRETGLLQLSICTARTFSVVK